MARQQRLHTHPICASTEDIKKMQRLQGFRTGLHRLSDFIKVEDLEAHVDHWNIAHSVKVGFFEVSSKFLPSNQTQSFVANIS
jgi:hypothetical protein